MRPQNKLASQGKGILAADESIATIAKRFESIKLENTELNRIRYRQMLFSTPGLSQYISGVIVYDETLRSNCVEGMAPVRHLQAQGIVVGIKVDKGLTVIPGTESENSTQGLDGLGDRCAEYYRMGARFAKWRAIYRISATTPSERAVQENSWALARYGRTRTDGHLPNGLVPRIEPVLFIYLFFPFLFLARYGAICQENGLVPIIEPEVLMDGSHDIERAAQVSST